MHDDKKLIKLIKNGDTECANKLIEYYYASILRYCAWHCKDSERAEDLTQETFLRVFRNLNEYDNKGSFRSYIYTIAHHLCVDEARKPICYALEEEIAATDEDLIRIENREEISHLLVSLSPAQREAVLLRFGADLNFKEIAQITGVPARTIQSRVRLALAIMRKEKS